MSRRRCYSAASTARVVKPAAPTAGVLVEAAWSPSRADRCARSTSGQRPTRLPERRRHHGTEMIVLAWHLVTKDQDSPSPDPARSATNAASLNSKPAPITAWEHPSGRRGLQQQAKRTEQGAAAEQAEPAYQLLVAHWQTRKPATRGSWVDDFRAASTRRISVPWTLPRRCPGAIAG